jgi:hypothetical protein
MNKQMARQAAREAMLKAAGYNQFGGIERSVLGTRIAPVLFILGILSSLRLAAMAVQYFSGCGDCMA